MLQLDSVFFLSGSDFTSSNRFGSYAPTRNESPCTWFVDGSDYMSTVADAIELAKEDIFIADWWLSPEIYLKRPAVGRDKWRLDTMLHRKAVSSHHWFIFVDISLDLTVLIRSMLFPADWGNRLEIDSSCRRIWTWMIDVNDRLSFVLLCKGRRSSGFRSALQGSGDGSEHQQPLHETAAGIEAPQHQSAPAPGSRRQRRLPVGPPREVGHHRSDAGFRRRHRSLLRSLGRRTAQVSESERCARGLPPSKRSLNEEWWTDWATLSWLLTSVNLHSTGWPI